MSAVLPSEDTATLEPNLAVPLAPVPVSFGPYCVHVEPERVNTHAAPTSAEVKVSISLTVELPVPSTALESSISVSLFTFFTNVPDAILVPLTPVPSKMPMVDGRPLTMVDFPVTPPSHPTTPLSPGPPISAVLPSEE